MASRVGSITQFAPLSPPWQLAQLDANFTADTTAFNDSSLGYVNAISTDTGTANNYIVALPFGSPLAYNQGMTVVFVPANTNTGASNITVSPLGSASIVDVSGNALLAGALLVGRVAVLVYVGSAFRLTNSFQSQLVTNPIVTLAGTTTIPCQGFNQISITLDTTGAPNSGTYSLLLTNVNWGAHIDMAWLAAGTGQTFKFSNACTDQAGNTIGNITTYDSIDGNVNTIGTGVNSITTYALFNGFAFRTTASGGVTSIRFLLGFR